MDRMIHAVFDGQPLPPDGYGTFPAMRDLGATGVRIEVTRAGVTDTDRDTITAALEAGLRPVVLCARVEDVVTLARWRPTLDLELHNEPDINGPGPLENAADVEAAMDALASWGLTPRLWVGVVSNLNDRGLDYLAALVAHLKNRAVWESVHGVSVHWYPHGAQRTNPHPGYASREAEVAALKRIIGDKPFAVSEFGFHTADQKYTGWLSWLSWLGQRWHWTDIQVMVMAHDEFAFWSSQGAAYAVLYQRSDGPNNVPLERYGVWRMDGSLKPVAGAFSG